MCVYVCVCVFHLQTMNASLRATSEHGLGRLSGDLKRHILKKCVSESHNIRTQNVGVFVLHNVDKSVRQITLRLVS